MSATRKAETIAAVRRLSLAGLEAETLLRRVARVLHRAAPFEYYAAATIDPASNLITDGFAEPMNGSESARRPVSPIWFDRFYFAEGLDETTNLLRRRHWAATIGESTNGQLERSLCYTESMRPAGVADKVHAVFVDRGLWGDIELYREVGSPPFSPDEVDLVRRVAPEVGSGLKLAALRGRAEAEGETGNPSAPGVLVVDGSGAVTSTAAAESLLGELTDLRPGWRTGGELPIPVQVALGALRQSLAADTTGDRQKVPSLRTRTRTGRWLTLHAALSETTSNRPAEQIVVITPARPPDVAWLQMTAYGLSPREEEVVKLVVGGQSTRQISDRLFIAEHTVQRHLSNIYEKVGVRGRRALVKHVFFEQVLPNMAGA